MEIGTPIARALARNPFGVELRRWRNSRRRPGPSMLLQEFHDRAYRGELGQVFLPEGYTCREFARVK